MKASDMAKLVQECFDIANIHEDEWDDDIEERWTALQTNIPLLLMELKSYGDRDLQ